MRKKLVYTVISLLALIMLTFGALAAGFTGKIWTNKPTLLGIGYYCTAAQNTSTNGTNLAASAYSKNSSGAKIAADSATGNNKAVANSGSTRPHSGYGQYKETGAEAHAYFSSGAWN
jgi:hypothetical protein